MVGTLECLSGLELEPLDDQKTGHVQSRMTDLILESSWQLCGGWTRGDNGRSRETRRQCYNSCEAISNSINIMKDVN